MDILILEYNSKLLYRGTERPCPYHCDELAEEHSANKAFFWYLEEGGELGIVHNINKTLDLISLYAKRNPPCFLEAIEVKTQNKAPESKGIFLGFDISCGFGNSLLYDNVLLFEKGVLLTKDLPYYETAETIEPLLKLTGKYFAPSINQYGLLDNYEIASFCLKCLNSIRKVCPGLLEYGNYEVVGLNKISE